MKRLMLFGLLLVSGAALAQETPTPTNGVSLTVYNTGSALVQDRRTFALNAGQTVLNFTDVAATIDPTSVSFVSLTDPTGTYVLEQNYVYDLVNSQALLDRYLDQTIEYTARDGTVYTGQLLSGRGGDIILREASGEVRVLKLSEARDIKFPALPDGLITRPTLRWLIESATGGEQQVELTYLANGLTWTSDYTVLLGANNRRLDLNGWITLTNTSGTAFTDAQLKLVAGDVNRITPQIAPTMRFEADAMAMAAPTPQVEQRDFSEYKLYEIARPVTVGSNETKQVQFVAAAGVTANTFYVYDSSPGWYNFGYVMDDRYYGQTGVTTVGTYLEFSTGEDGGVGAALPAGRVRVYQQDVDGSALLIGENTITHTPKGETIQMYLGNAFDLVGERVQTNYNAIAGNVLEESYEITLRNRKETESVEIRVPERLFRWTNWQIIQSSIPFIQLDSNTIEFRVTVPAGGEVKLSYTVRYTYPR
jgi:hypothetical protein